MLAPNKQNLLLLKATLKSQQNGYRLLKEKRSGLILNFLQLAKQGKTIEKEVSNQRQQILSYYLLNLSLVSQTSLNTALGKTESLQLISVKKKMSGVSLTQLKAEINIPDRSYLRTKLQIALATFASLFPKIIMLSQLKSNCQLLAFEIKKVTRQISNLEQKIEQTVADLKFIKQTLDERNNLEKATLIKSFS